MVLRRAVIALTAIGFSVALWPASMAAERNYMYITGSSVVYPFTKAVAEHLVKAKSAVPPIIEPTGTAAGIEAFCGGLDDGYPDIANASRRMKKNEFETCQKNGVKDIIEIPVGLDGVTIARSKSGADFKLTSAQLFLALAEKVPGKDGRLIANPYKKWSDIDPSLPNIEIVVLGPGGEGTRQSLHELLLRKGAENFPILADIKKQDENSFEHLSATLRADGAFTEFEAGKHYQAIFLKRLAAETNTIAIFEYSYLEANRDIVAAIPLNGVELTYNTIVSGRYPGTRKLYIYIKKARVGHIPHLDQFLAEYFSASAWGQDGYLTRMGLAPTGEAEFTQTLATVKNMTVLAASALGE
jgi:phosphate transport system substrate-binding protein